MLPPLPLACPPLVGCSGLLESCRMNRERAVTEVCGEGGVAPRVALKRELAAFEEGYEAALDVLGTPLDHRLAAHNARSRESRVAHRQEVADPGVLARHEGRVCQQLFDLLGAHVRPKKGAKDLALELNE